MKMIRTNWVFALSIFIIAFQACSPKVIGIYNEEVLHDKPETFFVNPLKKGEQLSESEKQLNNTLVNIIREDLMAKGLKRSSIPDLYVSVIINVHTSKELTQNNYSRYDYSRYYNYNYFDPYNVRTSNFKEGVIIIDIKNQDNKLVWQGSKTFKVKVKGSVQSLLPEICGEVVASFDPGRF